jgi:hypothetical protein
MRVDPFRTLPNDLKSRIVMENPRDNHLPFGSLIVFDKCRHNARKGKSGTVQRVDDLRFAAPFGTKADVDTPCLVCLKVADR